MEIDRLIIAVLIMAGVTFLTRGLPFLLYKRRNPPKIILFAQRYIPPMVMLILVVYALKDASWRKPPHGIPELTAAALTAGLHLWKRNALISIFSGTAVYMILVQTGVVAKFFTG
jgi:branched-subunit amino acid transport protein AzlD